MGIDVAVIVLVMVALATDKMVLTMIVIPNFILILSNTW